MKLSKFQGHLGVFALMLLMMGASLPAVAIKTSPVGSGNVGQGGSLLLSQLRRFKFNRIRVKAPSNRITLSASVRGTNSCQVINKNKDIMALLPTSLSDTMVKGSDSSSKTNVENVELTTSAYPNILFYLPENSPETATFGLRGFDKGGNVIPQRIYSVNVKLPRTKGKDGIVVLNVGDLVNKSNIPELEFGKSYVWNVTFCNQTRDGEISGLIRRVDPNVPLVRQLDASSLPKDVNANSVIANELRRTNRAERPLVYAQNGIWYSAVSSLAEVLRSNPQGSTAKIVQASWEDLLSVNLKDIAKKPILGNAKLDK